MPSSMVKATDSLETRRHAAQNLLASVSGRWIDIGLRAAAGVGIALDLSPGDCLLVGGLPERLVRIVCAGDT